MKTLHSLAHSALSMAVRRTDISMRAATQASRQLSLGLEGRSNFVIRPGDRGQGPNGANPGSTTTPRNGHGRHGVAVRLLAMAVQRQRVSQPATLYMGTLQARRAGWGPFNGQEKDPYHHVTQTV